MQTKSLAAAAAATVLLTFQSVLVAGLPSQNVTVPSQNVTEIVARDKPDAKGDGTKAKPWIFELESAKWESVHNVRCVSHLCFKTPNPYQYHGGEDWENDRRKESGALEIFQDGDGKDKGSPRKKRGVRLLKSHPGWKSAEEPVRASSLDAKTKRSTLGPCDSKQNTDEGADYSGHITHNKVKEDDYIKEEYKKSDQEWCKRYEKNDATECKPSSDDNDVVNRIYMKTNHKHKGCNWYHLMEAGKDTWSNFDPDKNEPPKDKRLADKMAARALSIVGRESCDD